MRYALVNEEESMPDQHVVLYIHGDGLIIPYLKMIVQQKSSLKMMWKSRLNTTKKILKRGQRSLGILIILSLVKVKYIIFPLEDFIIEKGLRKSTLLDLQLP